MAHYLIVKDADIPIGTRVEAKNSQQAIEQMDLEDGEAVKVYRIIAEPKTVKATTKTVRSISIE